MMTKEEILTAWKAEDNWNKYGGDPSILPVDNSGEWIGPVAGEKKDPDRVFLWWDAYVSMLWLAILMVLGSVSVTVLLLLADTAFSIFLAILLGS